MKREGLIVDNFAGGGGASTGIEAALGRAVDIAINHDEQAIRMHEANHPGTLHIRNNIWQVDPAEVTAGRPVQLAWFSPDCKHFSKAKGGKPREKSIRDLAWVVVLWAERVRPDVILLENVEEFRTWGPLCGEGKPIKDRAGETFEKWRKALRRAGYKLQFRELRACDYGAPTIRKRFFMIARRDGQPIVWPEPSHGKPGSPEVLSGKRLPWRTAAEIIDWSIPCPSIFERKKPLADKTLRRIAHGIMKFVVNNPRPFIVGTAFKNTRASRAFDIEDPVRTTTAQAEYGVVVPHVTKFRSGAVGHEVDEPLHTVTANSFVKRPGGCAPLGVVEAAVAPFASYAQQGGGNRSVEDPLHTVTASDGDHNTVVAAHLIHRGNGEREGQAPRAMDVEKPLGTAVASGQKHAAVTAFLHRFGNTANNRSAEDPLRTVTTAGGSAGGQNAIVVAHIEQANGGPNNDNLAGRPADAPISTIATKGSQQRVVTALLSHQYTSNTNGGQGDPAKPHKTITTGGHHAVVEAVADPADEACPAGAERVAAFLLKYYGNESEGHDPGNPLGTVTTKDRFGLVTVTIEGEEYVIVDIGMRMLTPRELFNAQGFPPDYIIDHDASGSPITKTAQVAKCGNSVCPPIAEALVRAQFPVEAADEAPMEAVA